MNVTNDAWFGDSTAAHQHLQISRMQALEAGRQLLRAANDGISAIIAANGVVEKTFPRFKPGVLTGDVQPRIGLTPYAKSRQLARHHSELSIPGGRTLAAGSRRKNPG